MAYLALWKNSSGKLLEELQTTFNPKFNQSYLWMDNFDKYPLSTGWTKKPNHIQKCITPAHDGVGRHLIYQNVQLFIRSKNGILNVDILKYSLHNFQVVFTQSF